MLKICYVFLGLICNFETPTTQIIRPKIYNCATPEVVLKAGEERGFYYLGSYVPDGYQITMGQAFNPKKDTRPSEIDISSLIQVWRSQSGFSVYVLFEPFR